MIAVARANGLEILLSCMIESSLGIAAALAAAPLVDWLDRNDLTNLAPGSVRRGARAGGYGTACDQKKVVPDSNESAKMRSLVRRRREKSQS